MILECPSCSARFMLSSDALGSKGREVRCGKCAHMWFQPPERDSLDDLPRETIGASESSSARQADINALIDSAISGDTGVDIDFQEHVAPKAAKPKASKSKFEKQVETEAPSGKRRHILAILAGIVLGIIPILYIAMNSENLSQSSPFLARSYAAVGMLKAEKESKVAFDRLKISRNANSITGSGYVINLSDSDIQLNDVTVDLVDMDYKVLKSEIVKIDEGVLAAESTKKFDFTFKDIPREAVSVRASVKQ